MKCWKTQLNQTVQKDQKKFIQCSVCDTWQKITKMCVTYTLASYSSSSSSIAILIIFIIIVKSLNHYHHHHHYYHHYFCMTFMFPQCKKMTRICRFQCMLTSTPFSQCAQCQCAQCACFYLGKIILTFAGSNVYSHIQCQCAQYACLYFC